MLIDNEGTGVVKEIITQGYAVFYHVELFGIDIQVERDCIVTSLHFFTCVGQTNMSKL